MIEVTTHGHKCGGRKSTPSEFPGDELGFYIPSSLDWMIPNWRKVEDIEIDKPYLVF